MNEPREGLDPAPADTASPALGGGSRERSVARVLAKRMLRVVRPEDLLLVAWILVVTPLLATAQGGGRPFELAGEHSPLVGGLYLVVAAGAVACLLTRGSREPLPDLGPHLTPRTYARFPFMVAVSVIAGEGAESLGFRSGDPLMAAVFVAAIVGVMIPGRLPVLEPSVRRALVLPSVLVGTSIFEGFMAEIWEGITLREILAGFQGTEASFVAFILVLLAFASLAFYAMLVFAPRQVAEVEGSWFVWGVRFALFLASVILGVGWVRIFA